MALEPCQTVNQSDGPPPRGWCQLFAYNGDNQPEYQGWAQSLQNESEWTVVSGALTSIAVASDVATATTVAAHGLQTGVRVVVQNATDPDLNGSYVITVTSSTEFTFATANVADDTFTNASLRISTRAPRTTHPVWIIKRFYYTTNLLTRIGWAEGQSESEKFIWDSRSDYAYL